MSTIPKALIDYQEFKRKGGKSVYAGETLAGLHPGQDSLFKNNFVIRSLNGDLVAFLSSKDECEATAKRLEATLQWKGE